MNPGAGLGGWLQFAEARLTGRHVLARVQGLNSPRSRQKAEEAGRRALGLRSSIGVFARGQRLCSSGPRQKAGMTYLVPAAPDRRQRPRHLVKAKAERQVRALRRWSIDVLAAANASARCGQGKKAGMTCLVTAAPDRRTVGLSKLR